VHSAQSVTSTMDHVTPFPFGLEKAMTDGNLDSTSDWSGDDGEEMAVEERGGGESQGWYGWCQMED
jgi:hypothetical protein